MNLSFNGPNGHSSGRTTSALISLFVLVLAASPCFSQRGKDGAKTVSGANTMVNEYTPLTSDAAAGSSTIYVANCNLNSGGYFSGPLAPGDLIFIMQAQGATIIH